MGTKVVKAPFHEGQVSIGPRTFDVENYIVVGLMLDDPELAELQRAFGLTVEHTRSTRPKPALALPVEGETLAEKEGGD